MSQELIDLIITIAPSIASIFGVLISVILTIRKVASTIADFKQSNELKENNELTTKLLKDNEQLKKLNEKLLVELTNIRPFGWTEDDGSK